MYIILLKKNMAFSTCHVSLPRGPFNAGHEELQDQRLAPLHWLCGTGVFGARFNFVPVFNTEPRRGFVGFFCGNFRGNYRHRLLGFAGIFELLWSIIWPQCRKIHFKQDTNENLRAAGFQWLESLGSLTPHGLLEFVLENPPKFHSFTVPIRAAMKNQQFRS